MSSKRKKTGGNPAKAGTPDEAMQELEAAAADLTIGMQVGAAFREYRERIGIGAILAGDIRANIDPDALVLRQVLEALESARKEPGGGGMLALTHALNQAGIHDADGLWRAIEACTSAASVGALVWAEDYEGTGPVNITTVIEAAAAYRPESLRAFNERREQRRRDTQVQSTAS